MASKNNENSSPRNADKVICESLTLIKNDKKTALSAYNANKILRKSKKTARRYKVCGLDKAEESHSVYQDIMSCVTIDSYKKVEVIQKNIDEYAKKDDELEKMIKDASKLLKELRVKIEDADTAACAMSNCFKNKIQPNTGKSKKDDQKKKADGMLQDILEKTKKINDQGQNAFESAVSIAGIQTFTNAHSLQPFATNVTNAIKEFKTTVETNITSTAGDVTSCREELNNIAGELAQITCDKKSEAVKYEALDGVVDFVCKGEYDCDLLDLCTIKEPDCYDHDYDGYDQRKKDRRQKRQTKDMD